MDWVTTSKARAPLRAVPAVARHVLRSLAVSIVSLSPVLALRRLRARDQVARLPDSGRWLEALVLATLFVALPLAAAWAYRESLASGYEELAARGTPQLDIHLAGLDAELRRHEQLAAVAEMNLDLLSLLESDGASGVAPRVNASLARLAGATGARAMMVLDRRGRCVAASDTLGSNSPLGEDFSDSELFRRALQSGEAGFLGAGNGGSESTEYHFARLVRQAGQPVGLIVVHADLQRLESLWQAESGRDRATRLLLVDENDVVMLTSQAELKYQATRLLPPSERERLRESGRYRHQPGLFQPLGATVEETLPQGAVVRMTFRGANAPRVRFLAQERALGHPVARAILYTDASGARTNAIRNAAAAAAAILVAALLCLYLLQMRRSARQRQRARELLQQAHDDLGRRVEERTAELRQINQELMREIAERERAEAVLRTAQQELVQAGKMAMIGQMAAGVAHEINQPLMALRALSDNIRVLLQRGRTEDAAARLEGVADLTDRMGRITAQLKTFARKSSGGGAPQAQLARCVANALELLRNRIRAGQVQVDVEVPQLAVACEATRLEQVLLNLVGNALDAMKEQAGPRRVFVGAAREGGRALVRVADNGPGVAPEAAGRLFEPFFSTKPQGEGLGLGLVISESIVREWGGSLRLVAAGSGAAFEFDLPLAAQEGEP